MSERFIDACHQTAEVLRQSTPSAQTVTADDLAKRCAELLEWSKTGLLAGGKGGAVRALADQLAAKIGENYALSVAESQTKDDAMRAVLSLTSSLAAASARIGEMLAIVKRAYYSEPAGTAENAWNDALEHIEEGFAALSQTEEGGR